MDSEISSTSKKPQGYDDIRAIFLNTVAAQVMHKASIQLKESHAVVIRDTPELISGAQFVSNFLMKNGMEKTLFTAKLESGGKVSSQKEMYPLQRTFKFNPNLDFFVQLIGSTRPTIARKIMPKEYKEYQDSLSGENQDVSEAKDLRKKNGHSHSHAHHNQIAARDVNLQSSSHSHSHKHSHKDHRPKHYEPIGGINQKPSLEERMRNILKPTWKPQQDTSFTSLGIKSRDIGKPYFAYDTEAFRQGYGKKKGKIQNKPEDDDQIVIQPPKAKSSTASKKQQQPTPIEQNQKTPSRKESKVEPTPSAVTYNLPEEEEFAEEEEIQNEIEEKEPEKEENEEEEEEEEDDEEEEIIIEEEEEDAAGEE